MRNRSRIAFILGCLFLGISAAPLFLREAPPSAADKVERITQFEEASEGVFRSVLRSSHEGPEETSRPHDFIAVSRISSFHSVVHHVCIKRTVQLENKERPRQYLYLMGHNFLI